MTYIAITLSVIALSIGLTLSAAALVEKTPLLKLTSANDDFGLRLMQALEQVEHTKAAPARANVFISPFSVNSVLAMLLAGGAEQTHAQIYNALGFANSQLTDKNIFENLHRLLTEVTAQTGKSTNVLNIANSLAIQKEYPILESFLSNITTYFGSHVFTEDFTQEAPKATKEINDWVNEQTHGKIAKLFSQDLEASTRLVLLNAIYFKGTWKTIFAKNHTAKSQFHMDDTAQEEIEMMNVLSHFNYVHSDDGQLLELPYQDESLSMYIFLPSDKSKAISSIFTSNQLTERIAHLHSNIVNVHIPKFKFEQTYHLGETLKKLGIEDAFSKSGKADFSNIDGKKEKRVLYLSEVVHKTFIEVNEEGSEAAAATGAIVSHRPRPGPPPPPIVQFRADHPFMFFIRHKQHGVTLFSGIVNKP